MIRRPDQTSCTGKSCPLKPGCLVCPQYVDLGFPLFKKFSSAPDEVLYTSPDFSMWSSAHIGIVIACINGWALVLVLGAMGWCPPSMLNLDV